MNDAIITSLGFLKYDPNCNADTVVAQEAIDTVDFITEGEQLQSAAEDSEDFNGTVTETETVSV